jgi:4-hydroxy-tetrahydrodipicolinate synthase
MYCPNVVPLDEKGEIDEAELRRYVDWLIEKGVHGLYPNGSTGEFTRFSPEERRRIIEIVIDQTAGRVHVLAGAAEANVRETLAACERYAELGADAVAIVAPFYYKLSSEGVYAYFAEIGRNTPVSVTLYNIPLFASPIELDTVRRLADEHERIVAIKDSSGDIAFMLGMIEAVRPSRPDFSFLANATSSVAPEITRQLFENATAKGRLPEARELQRRVTRLFLALFGAADFPEGFRMGLGIRGIRAGAGRMPRSAAQLEEDVRARERLAALLREEGLS